MEVNSYKMSTSASEVLIEHPLGVETQPNAGSCLLLRGRCVGFKAFHQSGQEGIAAGPDEEAAEGESAVAS